MGIPGLTKVLKDHLTSNDAIQEVTLTKYSGKRVAIDVNIYLHGFAYNPTQKKPNCHIDGFFQMICDLLKNNIVPVMVLDGKPPKAKDDTILNRAALKQENRDKVIVLEKEIDTLLEKISQSDAKQSQSVLIAIDTNTNNNMKSLVDIITEKQTELEKYVKRDIKIQSTMYTDLRTLFQYMGVPCLQAKGEADALCVRLYKEGHVVAVMSEDMDILPSGGTLIRGIKDKRTMILTEYNLEKIIADIGFTQEQMVDLCILCGCDYSVKVQGIAAKTGLSLIAKHKNIETVISEYIEPEIQKCQKNNPEKAKERVENFIEFKENYLEARRILMESYKEEDITGISDKLKLGTLDKVVILPYLMEKCRYKQETLNKKMIEIGGAYGIGHVLSLNNLETSKNATPASAVNAFKKLLGKPDIDILEKPKVVKKLIVKKKSTVKKITPMVGDDELNVIEMVQAIQKTSPIKKKVTLIKKKVVD